MRYYKKYNKQDLIDSINNISIQRVGSTIVTKYGNRTLKTANVSDRYEVFDIKKYLIDKLDHIEENFEITSYSLFIKGGIQELILLSDEIDINGVKFQKAFFILNSSDKSRRLSFSAGLRCKDHQFYLINTNNISLNRKHLTGITEKAEKETEKLNDETFDEAITAIRKLVGHRVKMSELHKAIVGDGEVKTNHLKFDSLRKYLLWYDTKLGLTNDEKRFLRTPSEKIDFSQYDFYVDAFHVFNKYLSLYRTKDSHLIKNESKKVLKLTQWSIRNKQLEKLGI